MKFELIEDPQKELKRILGEGKAQGLSYDEIMPDPELAFLDFHLKITGLWEEVFPRVPSVVSQHKYQEHTQFFADPPHPTCVYLHFSRGRLYGVFSVQTDRWWQYLRFAKDESDNTTIEVRPRPTPDDLYNLRIQNPYEVLEALTRKYNFIEKLQQVFHDIQSNKGTLFT